MLDFGGGAVWQFTNDMSSGFVEELQVATDVCPRADQSDNQTFQNGRALGRAGSQVAAAYMIVDGVVKVAEGAAMAEEGLLVEPVTVGNLL
jgi:hypothetical protein